MTLKLSELVNETEDVQVEIAGEPITLTCYRHTSAQMRSEALKSGRITKEEFDELASADSDDLSTFPFPTVLAVRLKAWTLEVEMPDGSKQVPGVTSAFLAGLKDRHFLPLWQAVFGGTGGVPTDAPG